MSRRLWILCPFAGKRISRHIDYAIHTTNGFGAKSTCLRARITVACISTRRVVDGLYPAGGCGGRCAVTPKLTKAQKNSDDGNSPQSGEVKLLSGGNPQIPKGYGDGPVQAYIAAMPDWKSAVGARLDKLIVQAVPGVSKAVKWNSPF